MLRAIVPAIKREEDIIVPDDFHGDPDEYYDEEIERSRQRQTYAIAQAIYKACLTQGDDMKSGEIETTTLGNASLLSILNHPNVGGRLLSYLALDDIPSFALVCHQTSKLVSSNAFFAMFACLRFGYMEYAELCQAANAGGMCLADRIRWRIIEDKARDSTKIALTRLRAARLRSISSVTPIQGESVEATSASLVMKLKDVTNFSERVELTQNPALLVRSHLLLCVAFLLLLFFWVSPTIPTMHFSCGLLY